VWRNRGKFSANPGTNKSQDRCKKAGSTRDPVPEVNRPNRARRSRLIAKAFLNVPERYNETLRIHYRSDRDRGGLASVRVCAAVDFAFLSDSPGRF
jgi:hypothetical protein